MKRAIVVFIICMLAIAIFADKWQDKLFQAIEKSDLKAVEKALEKGADPNVKDKNGKTALELAKEKGCKEIIKTIEDEATSSRPPLQKLSVNEVKNALEKTRNMVVKGEVKEVKLDTRVFVGTGRIEIGEWVIDFIRGDGFVSGGYIFNKNANADFEHPLGKSIAFAVPEVSKLAKQLKVADFSLITASLVKRPDDPAQTLLVIASKDELRVYLLEKGREIEIYPRSIQGAGINRNPMLSFEVGFKNGEPYVGVVILPENAVEAINSGKTMNIAYVRVKPAFENPEISKVNGAVIFEVVP